MSPVLHHKDTKAPLLIRDLPKDSGFNHAVQAPPKSASDS